MGDFIPDEQFKPDQTAPGPTKAPGSASQDFIPEDSFVSDEDKYGTLGQQAITGLEGAAQGIAGPLAPLAERTLGVDPEGIRLRSETNPWTHSLSEGAGFIGSVATGTGLASVAGKVGEVGVAGAKILGAGKIASNAAKLGTEMALLQSAEEASKYITEDPNQTAESALSHIALSTALGAGTGGIFGAVHPLWEKANATRVGQSIQDFKNSISDHLNESILGKATQEGLSKSLSKLKPNATEIADAASRNGWPVAEGMLSGSKEIQMAEDALLNGPPTVSSISRRKVYQEASSAVTSSVDNATAGAQALTETQAGNALKESLSQKLSSQYEPIKELYSAIEPYQEAIPVAQRSTKAMARTIESVIKDEHLIKGTAPYNFVKTISEGIEQVDNLATLKSFGTSVGKAAGPETKYVASLIKEKLDGVEERAIKAFAGTMKTGEAKDKILDLIGKSEEANGAYRGFREQLQTLGNSLGKKKIYGPQDFIDFIDEMNPQTLAKRLFNESNTEFMSHFAKSFPEEFQVMRNYQRGLIRESALKDGVFNAGKAIKDIHKLDPEMRKLLFTEAEQQTLKDAQTYLNSFPKDFNPSHTAHESAFREFFEHPMGAAIANVRDLGIQSFIKMFGAASHGADKEAQALFGALGKQVAEKETNVTAFKHSMDYLMSAIKNQKLLDAATKAVFIGGVGAIPVDKPDSKAIAKLDDRLKEIEKNPTHLFQSAGQVGHYLPDHGQAIAKTTANAANVLNSQRPQGKKLSPLDAEIKPSKQQLHDFDRKLMLAEQPLVVLDHIKKGTLLPQDVATIQALYPAYYQKMSRQLTSAMMDHVSKGEAIPYIVRQSLSLFLGQALDSTFTPIGIQSAQSVFMQQKSQPQPQEGMAPKKSTSKLGKSANNYMTPDQGRQMRSNKT